MSNVVPIRRAGTAGADALLAAPGNGSHLAHFYEDEGVLFEVAGRFLGGGLRAGERALLIATQEHARGIAPHPASFERAVAEGRLLVVDAGEMLEGFMVGGAPDRGSFRAVVTTALDRLAGGARGVRVRVFSEMVDVLCRRHVRRAAMQLEGLWSEVLRERRVTKLCGYVMSSFYEDGGDPGQGFADVCGAHTHVLPPESFSQIERSAEPLVEISRLSDAARLAAAERRFRLLVASVRDYAVFMLDPRGFVRTWNPGAERIKGWHDSEIVGRHFSAFYPPEDVAGGKCDLVLAIAAEKGRYEDVGWRMRKDGSFFWAHVIVTALREHGQLVGFAKLTRDLKRLTSATYDRTDDLRRRIAVMNVLRRQIQQRGGLATHAELELMDRQLQHMQTIVEGAEDRVTSRERPTATRSSPKRSPR